MDASELAAKLLQYEAEYKALEALKEEIIEAVLDVGETQKAGNVTASYSGGRKTFDYQTAAVESPKVTPDIIQEFTKTVTTVEVDYLKVCDAAGLDKETEIPFTQSQPSVTLKVK